MSQTHIHLITNHLAIIGVLFAAIVLAIGLISSSIHTKIAAYVLMLISGIGGYITFQTGHEAEETAEHIKGVSELLIEQHEEFAETALWFIYLIVIAASFGLYAIRKKLSVEKKMAWIILLICTVSFLVFAWTGYLGGKIMHGTSF